MLDSISKWLGRLPGRLALLTVGFCTIFATMSGSQIATTSMMGTILTPDMEARGYGKPMSIGAVIGAGGLAMIIPPSSQAVILGAIGGISIGKLLISGIIPGLLLAILYATYIILRCWLQPSIAPPYDVKRVPFIEKVSDTAKYVLPLALIVFLVLGLIFLGWATPSESAAAGAIGSVILAAFYKKLNWDLMNKSLMLTVQSSANVLIIIAGSATFSQILAFSGVSRYLAEVAVSLPVSPVMLIILMQVLLVFLGCFMGSVPMIMITMPIFMPIVLATHFDPIAFGLITLINMETAGLTPPVGMGLFVMKSVSPETPMTTIYKAALPFIAVNVVVMALVLIFPPMATWLPSMIK
jgi:tripartite ATP-independent transporter DctM subunit